MSFESLQEITLKASYPTEAHPNRGSMPSIEMLNQRIENRDQNKETTKFVDDKGQELCKVDYNPTTGEVIAIYPVRYINEEQVAEKANEVIYITDEEGHITGERLTRGEARKQGKRYLIVTVHLSFNSRFLVQQRSNEKELDSGMLSSSAHGVAKEIFSQAGERIIDGQVAALINTALELNEELKHGSEPFIVKVWPGDTPELYWYMNEQNISDPNVVWLVPELYVPDSGYSMSDWTKPRTRALASGHIFSKEEPQISIDPSELQGYEWRTIDKILQDDAVADDLPESIVQVIRAILINSPAAKQLGPVFVDHYIDRMRGIPKERTD